MDNTFPDSFEMGSGNLRPEPNSLRKQIWLTTREDVYDALKRTLALVPNPKYDDLRVVQIQVAGSKSPNLRIYVTPRDLSYIGKDQRITTSKGTTVEIIYIYAIPKGKSILDRIEDSLNSTRKADDRYSILSYNQYLKIFDLLLLSYHS